MASHNKAQRAAPTKVKKNKRLTSLTGGDADGSEESLRPAHVRDSVHGFHLKSVVGVRQQLTDSDRGFHEAALLRHVRHVPTTRHTLLRFPAAPPAYDPVGKVVAAAGIGRRVPLEGYGGLVDVVDQILGS